MTIKNYPLLSNPSILPLADQVEFLWRSAKYNNEDISEEMYAITLPSGETLFGFTANKTISTPHVGMRATDIPHRVLFTERLSITYPMHSQVAEAVLETLQLD